MWAPRASLERVEEATAPVRPTLPMHSLHGHEATCRTRHVGPWLKGRYGRIIVDRNASILAVHVPGWSPRLIYVLVVHDYDHDVHAATRLFTPMDVPIVANSDSVSLEEPSAFEYRGDRLFDSRRPRRRLLGRGKVVQVAPLPPRRQRLESALETRVPSEVVLGFIRSPAFSIAMASRT